MKNYSENILIVILCLIFQFALNSCKKYVELPPPPTQLVTKIVFDDNATATSALTGIYGDMLKGTGFAGGAPNLSIIAGLSSDELTNYSANDQQAQFYSNAVSPTNGFLLSYFWSQPYRYIFESNAILDGLQNSSGVSSKMKQQLVGEAKFIRAFFHFHLASLFGDIPLVTSTDYQVNSVIKRKAKSEVYQQIISDLKDAQNLLSDNYIKYSTGNNISTTDRIRPNKWTAAALLARVYLYMGDWTNAEIQSTAIINNTSTYSLVSNLGNTFLKGSTEAIWQLQAVNPAYINTWDGNAFIFSGIPSNVALSNSIINAFEPGDLRKSTWTKSIIVSGHTYYYPFKYQVKTSSTVSEYEIVFRLAEQYLIRAEAMAQQGNVGGSASDLNIIRSRAGLSNITANDKVSLLLAIEQERQVELFTEWGNRWFDLNRTGRIDAILGVSKTGWKATAALLPIPQSEISKNPNLVQNPGY